MQASVEVLLNEGNSGREEIGDVRERDGNTYIFVKGSKFTKFSNFTMRIDYHGTMEDRSEAYILSCQKQDESIFTVPLHMSDLDSSGHFYSKIQKFRPSDSQILPEIGRRGKIHSHIDGLIKKYLNQEAKEGMFLIERTGFHNIGENGELMFVVGPDQKIPASFELTTETLEKEMLWIGSKSTKNLKLGPPLSSHEIVEILQQMKQYHRENMGSFLLLLAYYKVSTHRHELLQHSGVNMPSLHVIGEISTGKSHVGEHLRCLMPFIENSNGTTHLKRDDSPTETVVNEELGIEGPPLLYDPALNLSSSAMNKLSDNTFQGVLHRTKHTLGGTLKVARGLVQIHAHENASLPGLLPTALTKSVISVHHRQQNPDLEEMDKIHQSFVKKFEEYSGFFHCIVLPIKTTILLEDKNSYAGKMTADLREKFDPDILKTSGRAIDNYALMMAGQNQLFESMDLPKHVCKVYENELYSFLVNRCLPRTINSLLAADPKIGIMSHTYSKEELIKEISDALEDLSPRDFFQNVFMTKSSLHVAKELFTKGKTLKLRQAISLMDNSFTQTRCHFLSSDSEVDWFKRVTNKLDSRGSYCVYGSYSKKLGFVVPFPKVWQEFKQSVHEKCSEILPLTPNLPLKDIYKQICQHFDSQNMDQQHEDSEKQCESKLLEHFCSLSVPKQKIFLTKATKLHTQKVEENKKRRESESGNLTSQENIEGNGEPINELQQPSATSNSNENEVSCHNTPQATSDKSRGTDKSKNESSSISSSLQTYNRDQGAEFEGNKKDPSTTSNTISTIDNASTNYCPSSPVQEHCVGSVNNIHIDASSNDLNDTDENATSPAFDSRNDNNVQSEQMDEVVHHGVSSDGHEAKQKRHSSELQKKRKRCNPGADSNPSRVLRSKKMPK